MTKFLLPHIVVSMRRIESGKTVIVVVTMLSQPPKAFKVSLKVPE